MLTELMLVSWYNPGTLFLIISVTATDLLIACPMAFRTISLIFRSWRRDVA